MGECIVIDTETTGIKGATLIEYGYTMGHFRALDDGGHYFYNGGINTALYDPLVPIEYAASATHGITASDLIGCPPVTEFVFQSYNAQYLVGHNIDYDWGVIGKPQIKRICTLALARQCWPEQSHKLLALMYMLEPVTARYLHKQAHGVSADIEMTCILLRHISDRLLCWDFEGLWQASVKARVPTIMPFGKHKDKPIANLPYDYKQWALLNLSDLDPYLRFALGGPRP